MVSMARRIQIQFVAAFLILFPFQVMALEPSDILVSYSFDDNKIATGPDTFRVWEKAKGSVDLSAFYRFSGYYSVEIRDIPDDKDFPELQGSFALRKTGQVYAHFALMTTDPYETLNIALAGPKWFQLQKDGIGFWLFTRKGYLYHYSDSMPKKLFPLSAFTWYTVDVAYDIDNGTYDIIIHEEGRDRAIVSLINQKNAPNQALSSVDKFSFIGDLEDVSNVTYYIDDMLIAIDEEIFQLPFVAPGRRKLFIHRFAEYQDLLRQKLVCLPPTGLADFGMTVSDYRFLSAGKLSESIKNILMGEKTPKWTIEDLMAIPSPFLKAVGLWGMGCNALAKSDSQTALRLFEEAANWVPNGKMYNMSSALALAALEKWSDANVLLSKIYPEWQDDPRYDAALAMIGIARGDLNNAEDILRDLAEQIPEEGAGANLIRQLLEGEMDAEWLDALTQEFPENWRDYIEIKLISEQYYFILLWQSQFENARAYAIRMAGYLTGQELSAAIWLKRAGDAAFYLDDLDDALVFYNSSLKLSKNPSSVLLAISDIHFLKGNIKKEQAFREKIYGSLISNDGS